MSELPKRCKRCKYFDRTSEESGFCDKRLEEVGQNDSCSLYEVKTS